MITDPFTFIDGKPKSILFGETCSDTIKIENTSPESVFLCRIKIFGSIPENSFVLSMSSPLDGGKSNLEDITLLPGRTKTVWLTCMPKDIGLHTLVVHFCFGDTTIERVACLMVDDNISKALYVRTPHYWRCSQNIKLDYSPIVPCIHERGPIRRRPDAFSLDFSVANYYETFMSLLTMEESHLKVFQHP